MHIERYVFVPLRIFYIISKLLTIARWNIYKFIFEFPLGNAVELFNHLFYRGPTSVVMKVKSNYVSGTPTRVPKKPLFGWIKELVSHVLEHVQYILCYRTKNVLNRHFESNKTVFDYIQMLSVLFNLQHLYALRICKKISAKSNFYVSTMYYSWKPERIHDTK